MNKFGSDHRAGSFLFALPYLLIFGLTLFVYLVHQLYDGRIFTDHDLYYSADYFFHSTQLSNQAEHVSDFPQRIIDFWRSSKLAGRLPNTLLYMVNLVWPVNLGMFRFFNLPFFLMLIVGAYYLGKAVADKQAGLLCAVLAATLPIFDATSRTYLPHFHVLVFLLWSQVFVLKIFKHNHEWRNYLLLGFCSGAAVLCHPIGLLQTAPIFLFLLIFLLWKKEKIPLLKWGAAISLMLIMNISTWCVMANYAEEKRANIGSESIVQSMSKVEAANVATAVKWYVEVLSHNFLLPRFTALLAILSGLGVCWWLRKRKASFVWAYLILTAGWLVFLGITQELLNNQAGTGFDVIGAFSLVGFLPVLAVYQLAEPHRRAALWRSLLVAAVLLVGAWQKADSLVVVSTTAPVITCENRFRISLPKDWLWQTTARLREMGVEGRALINLEAFIASPASSLLTKMDGVMYTSDLIAAANLFSLHLEPDRTTQKLLFSRPLLPPSKNAGAEKTYRITLLFFSHSPSAKETARAIRRLVESSSQPSSWLYFDNAFQTFGLREGRVLIAVFNAKESLD